MTSLLPQAVMDLVVFHPVEDTVKALLDDEPAFADVNVQTLVEDDQTWPLVLVRRSPDWGNWVGDERFIDSGELYVHVFCEGLDADSDAAYLSEAVRVVIMRSVNKVTPHGYLTYVGMNQSPHRVSDWATAQGPVQYADLPAGVVRYETTYHLSIRAPRK